MALPTPPPTAVYRNFISAIRMLKRHGAPATVDASALRRRFPTETAQEQLDCFRFLGLIDAEGLASARLAELCGAVDGPNWRPLLAQILAASYAPGMVEGLTRATPAQLNQQIRDVYGVEGAAARRAATFLLAAVLDAKLPLSPYLIVPAGSRGRLRSTPDSDFLDESAAAKEDEALNELTARLIEKLPNFDQQWPDSIKEQWFAQFQELISLVKGEEHSME